MANSMRIREAAELLWKQGRAPCPEDALYRASLGWLGDYDRDFHAIEKVCREMFPERCVYDAGFMRNNVWRVNDHPDTTREDIQRIMDAAAKDVEAI